MIMQCSNPECKKENPDDSKFCKFCGTKIESCTKTCNNIDCKRTGLPLEAAFCPDCGWELAANAENTFGNTNFKTDNLKIKKTEFQLSNAPQELIDSINKILGHRKEKNDR
jgi:hypothetical protein